MPSISPTPQLFSGHIISKMDLGTDSIDGFTVTGMRYVSNRTATVKGLQSTIQTTSDIWYCPELQAVLKIETQDSLGYKKLLLADQIQTQEPDPSNFTMPAGYAVVTSR